MKRIFMLALSFNLLTVAVFAQNLTVGPSSKQLMATNMKSYEGSPFFNNSYTESRVKTNSQKEFMAPALRYNLYTQQLEYSDNDKVYAIQDSVQAFTMPDSLGHIHHFIKKKGEKKDAFYEILFSGNAELLKQYIAKNEVTEDWYTKKQVKKMVHQVIYFLNKDGKIQKISPAGKNIHALLADKKDKIQALIDTEKPDLNTDTGLIEVFKYYNASN
ncbi:hypothetical protein [Pedobacter punctiformis]|uniref:DUF4919 domain-containing protein n=1 Tax=Pedobacter punctiformis TaxID=3004097 RepID=A0ABT4L650_9SPHI|nr:hypothetical protein [Pedobacter sp. HCMS5-2]MCZ4243400.1 hypothetical protein [Pedobacter sp. HCMS5-2]